MKKIAIIIMSCFISVFSFAQFGGGTGTAQDPYRIYTGEDLIAFCDSMNQGHRFTDTVFHLMNDIEEPVTLTVFPGCNYSFFYNETVISNGIFNGRFNGRGHSINIDDLEYGFLFGTIDSLGILDSLKITGAPRRFISIVNSNYGRILNCINDINDYNFYCTAYDIIGYWERAGIAIYNEGLIENCINLMDITNDFVLRFCGICVYNSYYHIPSTKGIIRKCTNKGSTRNKNIEINGISKRNYGTIEFCINAGNFSTQGLEGDLYEHISGIAGNSWGNAIVQNCINTGDITIDGYANVGGIVSQYISTIDPYENIFVYNTVKNCLNTGKIQAYSSEDGHSGGYGIVSLWGTTILQNCLNIANNSHGAIMDTNLNNGGLMQMNYLENNYYDKQMCLVKGVNGIDIPNRAEGKLTHQLVGTSPELQAMLGDGWSYAEGRYPIPLGLENDSIAIVAATPIYLHYEDEDNYNHIDSVSSNFTVGLENNVTWNASDNHLTIEDNNAILLSSGTETITTSLGEYFKQIDINIILSEEIFCNVSGTVLDSENNPLADVVIACNNNGATTITNENGEYSFTTNANTNLLISASKAGYTFSPSDTTINVVVSDIENVNFIGILEGEVAIDENIANTFSVFPNPSNGIVNLVSKQNGEINIFDIAGKLVYRTTANAGETISFELQQGVYFVKQNTKVVKLIVE